MSLIVIKPTRVTSPTGLSVDNVLACSRRSDSGGRVKNKASERAGKNEGRLGERTSPSFFPALSLALFFARPPLSERLEQANDVFTNQLSSIDNYF